MDNSISKVLTILIALLITTFFIHLFNTQEICILLAIIIFVGLIFNASMLHDKSFIFFVVFVIVQFIWAILGYGITTYNSILLNSLYFGASVTICGFLGKLSQKQIKLLSSFILIIFSISIVSTFFVLLTNPNILREYSYDASELSDFVSSSGHVMVFSYGVGEGLAIMLPAIFCFGLYCKKPFWMVVSIIIVLFGIACQFMGTLATSAILSLVFCVAVGISYLYYSNKSRWASTILAVLVAGIVAAFALPKVSLSDNLQFMAKFEDMQASVSGNGAVGQVDSRAQLYLQSLKVCMHNPILGLGKEPINFGSYTDNMVSMHTTFFDYWGMYGLFALLLIASWKGSIKSSYNLLPESRKKQYRYYLLSLFLLLLLKGPVTISTNFFFSTVLVGIMIRRELLLDNTKLQEQ